MLLKQPNQTAIVGVDFTSVNQIPASQFDIAEVQAALKCKLPGCDKPCTIESSGHVHDFCSKAHAVAYTNKKREHKKLREDIKDPVSSMIPMPDGMFM